jgi:hypothetical protein
VIFMFSVFAASKTRLGAAIAASLLVVSVSQAAAQTMSTTSTSGHGNRANSDSLSQSGAVAIVNGDTVYNPNKIRQRIDSTASAIAPGLTAAGVHSCAGSASVGAAVTGFNFGIGSTYEMQECNRRAYAATLAGLGQNGAALALVCNNPEVMAALNQTGVICPQQKLVAVASAAPAPVVSAYASLGSAPAPSAPSTRNPCHGSSTTDMIECGRLASAAPAVQPVAEQARRSRR